MQIYYNQQISSISAKSLNIQYIFTFISPQMRSIAQIGKVAPSFKALSWNYNAGSFQQLSLDSYSNKWLLLFFYPLDFTFVCPTQIVEFSNKAKMFKQLNCEVAGCSIDSHYCHMQYTNKSRADGGLGQIQIPLISDTKKQIASDYGVLADVGVAYRGTFLIDTKKIIRHLSINDLPVGRNVDEYLRLLKAFQHVDKHGQVCPASWKPGEQTMVPDTKSEKLTSFWKNVHAKK